MQIRLTANVGIFSLEALVTGTDEAKQFAHFVYTLGDQEERVAIQQESAATNVATNSEPIDDIPFDITPAVTIEDAVKAVKDYAAVHKPDKARALMAQVGISRTSEITAEIAPKIIELIKGAA